MRNKINIDPITRLEGDGRITIFLKDNGQVEECLLLIPELRSLEKFLEGRPVEVVERLIQPGVEVSEALLNKIEMAFRAYDPCFAYATHSLPGRMPLKVSPYGSDREQIATLQRPQSIH